MAEDNNVEKLMRIFKRLTQGMTEFDVLESKLMLKRDHLKNILPLIKEAQPGSSYDFMDNPRFVDGIIEQYRNLCEGAFNLTLHNNATESLRKTAEEYRTIAQEFEDHIRRFRPDFRYRRM